MEHLGRQGSQSLISTNRVLNHSSGYLTKLASLTFAIRGICLLQIHTLIAIERVHRWSAPLNSANRNQKRCIRLPSEKAQPDDAPEVKVLDLDDFLCAASESLGPYLF